MVLSFCRVAARAVFVFAVAGEPAFASAPELATAQGMIAISEAQPRLRAPSCSELIVEARDALDNHLIAETQPTTDGAQACWYALTVPSQTAVWLRVQPVLVAGARIVKGGNANTVGFDRARPPSGSIALRFTIIAPTTYFFAPGERKVVLLHY